jgi:putative acetyltransferase
MTAMSSIRPIEPEDHARLLDVWLASVSATHHFLTEEDIQQLIPIVRDEALPNLEVWVFDDEQLGPVGFMGLDGAKLEALFVSPQYFRRGAGTQLIEFARQLKGPLSLSVNEQNPSALAFYLRNGFEIEGRSELDDHGLPFPLLHLRDRNQP